MRGIELREIRKANRISQERLGQLADAHRTTVSDWETGKTPVPALVDMLARLLDEHPELLPKIERWRGLRK